MIIGSKIYFFEQLTSTNSEAVRVMKENHIPEGSVISAGYQSAGRGQKGNSWESSEGKNLLISIILYPSIINPGEQFLISMAISLGICEFLRNYIPECKIKWPNDIYVFNDKIAGVLIENSVMGDKIEYSVAGIGLNINQEKFLSNAPNPISLKMVTGLDYDLTKCLYQLLSGLDRWYKQLLSGNFQKIRSDYISSLYRVGEWHDYSDDEGVFRGCIDSVEADGKLKLLRENGCHSLYGFKEIAFIQ